MRVTRVRIVAAALVAAVAAASIYSFGGFSEAARREAYIQRCNEEGAGGTFTSRDYCEELYEESKGHELR